MSELASTVRETLARLSDGDRALRRFGARAHRYELAAPGDVAPALTLPDDLRAFVAGVGSGGAGPGYGWIPLARAAGAIVEAPAGLGGTSSGRGARGSRPADDLSPSVAWTRALPLAHVGCGYVAVLPLDGAHRGEVWIDARALGHVAPIAPTFSAWYLAWLDDLARGALPPANVPAGRCALALALSGYLAAVEQRLGCPAGELAGAALRDALTALGPGAIAIAAETSPAIYAPGEPVDPCVACARLVEELATDGLARDVVAPGLPPLPCR